MISFAGHYASALILRARTGGPPRSLRDNPRIPKVVFEAVCGTCRLVQL